MKRIFLILSILFFSINSQAQNFESVVISNIGEQNKPFPEIIIKTKTSLFVSNTRYQYSYIVTQQKFEEIVRYLNHYKSVLGRKKNDCKLFSNINFSVFDEKKKQRIKKSFHYIDALEVLKYLELHLTYKGLTQNSLKSKFTDKVMSRLAYEKCI